MFNKKEWKATDSAKEVLGASNQNRLENGIAFSADAIAKISQMDELADNAKTADIRDAVNAIIKACKLSDNAQINNDISEGSSGGGGF